MTDELRAHTRWWGTFRVPHGTTARWRVGPSTLRVRRLPGEWRLAHEAQPPMTADQVEVNQPLEVVDADEEGEWRRIGLGGDSEEIELVPSTADRPVVSRPDSPFFVPPGEEVELFVSTPLWISVWSVSPRHLLAEFPSLRPSDTWFGPPTDEGELCYASKTHCRLRLEQLPRLPHRSITKVRIRNQATDTLPLERLKLGVPGLSLYTSEDNRILTPDVGLQRDPGGDGFALLVIPDRAPELATHASLLTSARQPAQHNLVVRAFNSLFTRRGDD